MHYHILVFVLNLIHTMKIKTKREQICSSPFNNILKDPEIDNT